jgi:large subunit ribosomal protein L1
MKHGKKYEIALALIKKDNLYGLDEATQLVKKTSITKFDATIDLAVRLNLDPRKAEQNLRGAIVLPHGTGKVNRVLVIADGEKAKEALEAGADYVGTTEYLTKIQEGWFEFDVMVATPDKMAQLGKLGKILGPKGLMPNPKTGTVTTNVANAVYEIKNGKIEYRVDKVGNIHAPVGRVSFTPQQLGENISALYGQLIKIKPATVKGTYVKNVTISSTMGPSIRLKPDFIK